MSEHTPTPWTIDGEAGGPANIGATDGGRRIHIVSISGSMENPEIRADADFIVRACNAHDSLVEALGNCRSLLRAFAGPDDDISNLAIIEADTALAKAESRS